MADQKTQPRAKAIFDDAGAFYGIQFVCPGCKIAHGFGGWTTLPVRWLPPGAKESRHVANSPHWEFNGDMDRPTFAPSVLSTHEWPAEGDDPAEKFVCHSFIRDGRIQFLTDSTHALAGQTVDLPEAGEHG